MQLTSLPYQYKLKDGQQFSQAVNANPNLQAQNADEGQAQTVFESNQVNTISQIRKNSSNRRCQVVHKFSQEFDEFEASNFRNIIKKKESQEHNVEVATEKTRFTNVPDEQRPPSFSQNQNHTIYENSIYKNRLKNNENQFYEVHLNTQHLNTPKSNQFYNFSHQSSYNSNVPSQINSHFGSQQAFPDIDCQQINHNNCKYCVCSNIQSQQSLQQVDTLQEIERRPTNPKHIRSNQTLTTLTTAQNTYPQSQQGHQRAPSLSSVSKASQDTYFCTANLQLQSNQQNNLTTNNNSQSNQQINLPSRNLSFQNQANYELELDNDLKQMNSASHNNLDINKSSMNLIQSDRCEKTQANQGQDNISSNLIQNQINYYQQQQYDLGSDSSRCNYQFNQFLNQESPLPKCKLPNEYTKNKNIGLNARNHSFSEQQKPEQQNKQKNNSMKDFQIDETSPQCKEKSLKKDQQEIENEHINVSFSNLMNDKQFPNQKKSSQLSNSNQSPLDSNKITQSQGLNTQRQKQKKLYNTNLNPQESSNQMYTNSNMLNQSKLFRDLKDIDIKSAHSQVNLETNNNQEEHHNYEKSAFHKQIMDKLQSNQQGCCYIQTNFIPKNQDNIQINYALKSNRTANVKEIESKNKEYTNSFCCYPSQGETKHDLEKNSSNNSNNKYAFDNDTVLNEKNKKNDKGQSKSHVNCSFQEMKEKCQKALNQIDKINVAESHQKIPQLLQEYVMYEDFIKFLIYEAQQPIYNSEIDFDFKFQLNSDKFIKDVVVKEIKNLEKNQMLEFVEKKIESSCFYKIFKSFYYVFHRLFLNLIIFYMISCTVIFLMYLSNQEAPLLIEILIVLTLLFQIVISIIFNYFRSFQRKSEVIYIYCFICFSQIAIISYQQFSDERSVSEMTSIFSIILRVLQIIIQILLCIYFHKMSKAAKNFLLCFKIFKLNEQQKNNF
ncbi:hypothetical protein ABPG74_004710 [Tetrahymena malaccensis]